MHFSAVQVGCEGYDYPEDPFILQDSCQVVYSLKVPPGGRHSRDDGTRRGDRDMGSSRGAEAGGKGVGSRLLTWAALGVIGYVVYNALRNANSGPGGEPDLQPMLFLL